jgi:hypothetical protein
MAIPKTIEGREYNKFRESTRGKNNTAIDTFVDNTIYNPVPVATYADDSFGRIKVAPPHLLFDASFQYTLQEKVFIRREEINATITHVSNRASARLDCSSDVGSRARIRSRNYFPYSPAFTNTMIGSFCFHGSVENVTKRFGLYDERNGFFIQVKGNGFEVCVRSSIDGTTTDNIIEQSSWNVDKMDGTGNKNTNPSGVLLDTTKQNIIFLEFQWLGSGRVQFSFIIDGNKYIVHEFYHANKLSSLYSQTATLPIQAEIIGNGVASFMEFTCCSLASNGASVQHGHLHSASNSTTPKPMPSVGNRYPVISIRKQTNFTNVPVQILDMNAFSTTQDDFLVQIIHKGILTNAVWVDIPNSLCQQDTSASAVNGGEIVAQFYMKGNLQASEKLETIAKFWDLTLGDDFDGVSEIMTMAAIPLTNNASMYGIISFKEFE